MTSPPNSVVRVASVEIGNAQTARLDRRALPARKPGACARNGFGAQRNRGQSGGMGLSTRRVSTRPTARAPAANAVSDSNARFPFLPRSARRLALPVLTDVHERDAMRSSRRSRRCASNSGVSVPADRSADRGRANRQGRQCEEGPVPCAVGHEECDREDHRRRKPQRAGDGARRELRLQHARFGFSSASDHGQIRCAGRVRCHAFGAAAGRTGRQQRRRARDGALSRARRRGGWVAAVFMEMHQDPDHAPSDGPNMLKLSDMAALLRDLVAIDRVAKAQIS